MGEEAEERHQIEIKVYKQKVKHLLYEHQNNLDELKTENMVVIKRTEEEHRKSENELRKDKRSLKVINKDQELSHEDADKDLRLKPHQAVTALRENFQQQAKEIESKYERKMGTLRDELELKRKSEIHEIEERKNQQINQLMKNHEKAFADIKNYYNDITLNNLALINSLKEQIEDMKKNEERLTKEMNEVQSQNRKLVEPLRIAKAEVE